MFNSQIIDVGIGLALMYLFQSILVSGVNEMVVSVFSYRGKILHRFLNTALKDKDGGDHLFEKVTNSPYVINLKKKGKHPPEITSRNFADAILETINRDDLSLEELSIKIKRNILSLPDSHFRSILLVKYEEENGNVERFKHSIEDWFNDYMNKVSTWYKTRMSYFIIAFAFFVTAAMNVDSFRVMNELWKNEKLRESVVSMSEDITKQEYSQVISNGKTKDTLDLALDKITDNYAKLHMLDFPITWAYEYKVKNRDSKMNISDYSFFEKIKWSCQQMTLEKFLGFLITTLAVSIGAPIWFDVLKKLVGIKQQIVKLKSNGNE